MTGERSAVPQVYPGSEVHHPYRLDRDLQPAMAGEKRDLGTRASTPGTETICGGRSGSAVRLPRRSCPISPGTGSGLRPAPAPPSPRRLRIRRTGSERRVHLPWPVGPLRALRPLQRHCTEVFPARTGSTSSHGRSICRTGRDNARPLPERGAPVLFPKADGGIRRPTILPGTARGEAVLHGGAAGFPGIWIASCRNRTD